MSSRHIFLSAFMSLSLRRAFSRTFPHEVFIQYGKLKLPLKDIMKYAPQWTARNTSPVILNRVLKTIFEAIYFHIKPIHAQRSNWFFLISRLQVNFLQASYTYCPTQPHWWHQSNEYVASNKFATLTAKSVCLKNFNPKQSLLPLLLPHSSADIPRDTYRSLQVVGLIMKVWN
jgi:hypothetical protein